MFSAGETSSDQHASRIIQKLMRDGNVQCSGMGGQRMASAGMTVLADLTRTGVFGITTVFRHYFAIRRAFRVMEKALHEERPDLLVTVDFSGFNLRLAKIAQALGIKVLIYIAPQIWVSRAKRIHTIAKVATRVALILPFEKKLYDQQQIAAEYVGHPLVEKISAPSNDKEKRNKPYRVLLLPGSRQFEIKYLMPLICESIEKIAQNVPAPISFRLLLADTVSEADLLPYLDRLQHPCTLLHCGQGEAHKKYDEMAQADIAISASGTAVLELGMHRVPTVVIYKLGALNWYLCKLVMRINMYSLPNILCNRMIIPELIQKDATADKISAIAIEWLCDHQKRAAVRNDLAQVRGLLGDQIASENVVRMIREMVGLA